MGCNYSQNILSFMLLLYSIAGEEIWRKELQIHNILKLTGSSGSAHSWTTSFGRSNGPAASYGWCTAALSSYSKYSLCSEAHISHSLGLLPLQSRYITDPVLSSCTLGTTHDVSCPSPCRSLSSSVAPHKYKTLSQRDRLCCIWHICIWDSSICYHWI